MISVDVNYKGNCLNKSIKKDNFKKDLIILIETNQQININFFIYEYKFTIENKQKTKKDIHQASKHLSMPGTNLRTSKFNDI